MLSIGLNQSFESELHRNRKSLNTEFVDGTKTEIEPEKYRLSKKIRVFKYPNIRIFLKSVEKENI